MTYDKRLPYEEDIRLPLFVKSIDDSLAGKSFDTLVHTTDLGPTFLELAGVEAPTAMDGQSWAPLIQSSIKRENAINDDLNAIRKDILIEYYGEHMGAGCKVSL